MNYLSCTKYWWLLDVFKGSLWVVFPFHFLLSTLPQALPSTYALVTAMRPPAIGCISQNTQWDQPIIHVLLPPTLKIFGFWSAFKGLVSQILCVWQGSNLSCMNSSRDIISSLVWKRLRKEEEEKNKERWVGRTWETDSKRKDKGCLKTTGCHFSRKIGFPFFNSVYCLRKMIWWLKWWMKGVGRMERMNGLVSE